MVRPEEIVVWSDIEMDLRMTEHRFYLVVVYRPRLVDGEIIRGFLEMGIPITSVRSAGKIWSASATGRGW